MVLTVCLALIARIFHLEILGAALELVLGISLGVGAVVVVIRCVVPSFSTGEIQAVLKRGLSSRVVVQQENPRLFRSIQIGNVVFALCYAGLAYFAVIGGIATLLK